MFCALHIKPSQINQIIWTWYQTVHVFCKTRNSNTADSDMLLPACDTANTGCFPEAHKINGVALDLQSLSLKRPLRRCLPPHTFLYVKIGMNHFTAYLRVQAFHYIKSNSWCGGVGHGDWDGREIIRITQRVQKYPALVVSLHLFQ